MVSTPLNAGTREAILALLDDESAVVRRVLLEFLGGLGEEGREFLRTVLHGPNRIAAIQARWFLAELKFADPVSEFRGFIRSLGYELETGALLLSRTVHPELDVGAVCGELDRIAERCRESMDEQMSTRECCQVINRVLFRDMGFRGNSDHYEDPDNSFLDRVIARRTGLPVTLCILYLLVAERCGLRLDPVALPGHFVVGSYEAGSVFFVDVFGGGRLLSPDDVFVFLEERQIDPDATYLAPTTVRETLCRCCRNLARHYAVQGHVDHARLFADFVGEFENAYEQGLHS